jgi:tetratricopeptide (TPR) repeat protein/pimeloyl-ACP methyl ester carboxylesterase
LSAYAAIPSHDLREKGMSTPLRPAHDGSVVTSLLAASLFIAASLMTGSGSAEAADIVKWANCMGQVGPSAAIKECTAIINSGKELPDSLPYAYVSRGRAYALQEQNDLAIKDFSAALQFEPPLAHAHFWLGLIYKAREDWPHAIEEFGKAVASQAEDADIDDFTADSEGSLRAEALTEHGYALFKNGDDGKQSLADYEAATKLCPTCSGPFRNKALALAAQQKQAEALAAIDRAIALNVRAPTAFLVRGIINGRMDKYDLAITNYDEALRLNPDFELAIKARAAAVSRMGKSSAADKPKQSARTDNKNDKKAVSTAPVPPKDQVTNETAAANASALDDAALTKLLSGKSWEAKQGLWLATLEFRSDGSFRQRLKDQTEPGKFEVAMDGAWGISRDQLCLYTNVALCVTGHVAEGTLVLARADNAALEYLGTTFKLEDLKADAKTSPMTEFPIEEVLLPGTQDAPKTGDAKTGNTTGKTLLYYIHGFDGRARAHSPLPEYFVGEIQKALGWDIIDANYPRVLNSQVMRYEASNFGAAAFLARRLKELKAKGYARIIVGGQSWGGWTSLALSTKPDLPLDGVILVVPACCGWKFGGANTDDPNFANNKLYFDQIIQHDRYPTVAVFFSGDAYEPADRGKGAATALTRNGVPNLIINHPPGLKGHGSAWFPVFDYGYRECMVSFLLTPKTTQCPQRVIGKGDFNAVLSQRQLKPDLTKVATAPELIGRQFAVYPDGDIRKIVSDDQTEVKGYGTGESLLTSSFRDGEYCFRPRVKFHQPETTDEVCAKMIKWSDQELLAIDAQNGKVVQWWVEQK